MKKKIICAAIAAVMLLGLLVPASAAGLPDVEDGSAAALLVELGIINGIPDASGENYFRGSQGVTRAQMAKIICLSVLGPEQAEALSGSGAGFTDTDGHWAEPYIVWCAQHGIISGRGDGIFDPDAAVRGVECAKMWLLAISAADSELSGDGWIDGVNAAASSAGLELGLITTAAMRRDDLAELSVQALLAPQGTEHSGASLGESVFGLEVRDENGARAAYRDGEKVYGAPERGGDSYTPDKCVVSGGVVYLDGWILNGVKLDRIEESGSVVRGGGHFYYEKGVNCDGISVSVNSGSAVVQVSGYIKYHSSALYLGDSGTDGESSYGCFYIDGKMHEYELAESLIPNLKQGGLFLVSGDIESEVEIVPAERVTAARVTEAAGSHVAFKALDGDATYVLELSDSARCFDISEWDYRTADDENIRETGLDELVEGDYVNLVFSAEEPDDDLILSVYRLGDLS